MNSTVVLGLPLCMHVCMDGWMKGWISMCVCITSTGHYHLFLFILISMLFKSSNALFMTIFSIRAIRNVLLLISVIL